MQPRPYSHVSAQLIRPPSCRHIKRLQLRRLRGRVLFFARHRPAGETPPRPHPTHLLRYATAHPWQPWPGFQISFPDALSQKPPLTHVQGIYFFFQLSESPPHPEKLLSSIISRRFRKNENNENFLRMSHGSPEVQQFSLAVMELCVSRQRLVDVAA